jgi:hypothetical protein
MEPNGRDTGRDDVRVQVPPASARSEPGVVFDFTGLHLPELGDLAWILTARLQSAPERRVWVTALPESTWTVLRALGLDHLFHLLPGPGEVMN